MTDYDDAIVTNFKWIIFLKAERVALATGYLLLFSFTIVNIWSYMIKQGMYKSVPMLCCYISLILMSGVCVFYEFFMAFRCGEHDCIDIIIAYYSESIHIPLFSDTPESLIYAIVVLAKLRQQLLWSFGVFQCVMLFTLAVRMR